MTLTDRIHELVCVHGSLRAVGRVLRVDAGYLSRLYHGKKSAPSESLLRRMGLRKIVRIRYELRRAR